VRGTERAVAVAVAPETKGPALALGREETEGLAVNALELAALRGTRKALGLLVTLVLVVLGQLLDPVLETETVLGTVLAAVVEGIAEVEPLGAEGSVRRDSLPWGDTAVDLTSAALATCTAWGENAIPVLALPLLLSPPTVLGNGKTPPLLLATEEAAAEALGEGSGETEGERPVRGETLTTSIIATQETVRDGDGEGDCEEVDPTELSRLHLRRCFSSSVTGRERSGEAGGGGGGGAVLLTERVSAGTCGGFLVPLGGRSLDSPDTADSETVDCDTELERETETIVDTAGSEPPCVATALSTATQS
jgi:hypothetical protein